MVPIQMSGNPLGDDGSELKDRLPAFKSQRGRADAAPSNEDLPPRYPGVGENWTDLINTLTAASGTTIPMDAHFWQSVTSAMENSLRITKNFATLEKESMDPHLNGEKEAVDKFLALMADKKVDDEYGKLTMALVRSLQSFLSSAVGKGPTAPRAEDVLDKKMIFRRFFYPNAAAVQDPLIRPSMGELLQNLINENYEGEVHMDLPQSILYSLYAQSKKAARQAKADARSARQRNEDIANWYIARWMKTYLVADPNRMENVVCDKYDSSTGIIVLHGGYALRIFFPLEEGDVLRFVITVC
jgi:hypothetical protein